MRTINNLVLDKNQSLNIYDSTNAYLGAVKMLGSSLSLTGQGNHITIAEGNNLVFSGANATLGGTNSILSIGQSGDTVDLAVTGVTYNLGSIANHSDINISGLTKGDILRYDGTKFVNDDNVPKVINTVTGTNSVELVRGNMADNDEFRILVGGTASNAGYAEIATADDGSEPIYVRQYTGVFSTIRRTLTLLDASGNSIFPGSVTASAFIGALTGNASTATKLSSAVNINGIAFDGSTDITVYDSTKAPLNSPAFTGVPTAPTQVATSNSTLIATTEFVQNAILQNRVTNTDYTGGYTTYWYFPLVHLPIDNSSNYCSLKLNGRMGGWTTDELADFSILLSNRGNYTGNTVKAAIIGTGAISAALGAFDIVVYKQADLSAQVYIRVAGFFCFDFLWSTNQATSTYDGTYSTTVPTGTLIWQLSTAPMLTTDMGGTLNVSGSVGVGTVSTPTESIDTSGNVHTAGQVKTDGGMAVASKYTVTYNATEDSLDFIHV